MQNQAISKSGQEPHTAKIADLQVLRGISILLVMVCHFSLPKTLLSQLPVEIHPPFFLGVEIFFVLSGFVVCRTLQRDGFHAGRFLVRRAFRLYPAILTFLGLSFVVDCVLRYSTVPDGAVKSMFLFEDGEFLAQAWSILSGTFIWRQGASAYSNGAMWSLSVEFQFYAAAFVLSIGLVHICRLSQQWSLRLLAGVCGVMYAVMLAMRFAVLLHYPVEATWPRSIFYLMSWRFDFLTLGVVLAALESRYGEALARRYQAIGNYLSPWLLLLPLIAMSLCETPYNSVANKPFLIGFGHPIAAVCFAGLVLLAARNVAFPPTRGAVYRTLEWLGDRSYTIYLLHFPIFILAWMAIFYGMPSLFSGAVRYGVAQIVLVTAIGLPICMAAYRWIEVPCIGVGKTVCRWFGPAKAATTPAPPAGWRIDPPNVTFDGHHLSTHASQQNRLPK